MATPRSNCMQAILWRFALVLLAVSFWMPCSESAAVALTQYTMDQRSDCLSVGFLDVPRDQVIKLTAPSKDTSTTNQVLSCRLQFQAETPGDTLRVTLDSSSFINDCDVSLELQMMNSNSDKIIRGCKSGTGGVPALETVNGKASVWLSRRVYSNTAYWFEVTVTAVRTDAAGITGSDSTADIGLIVGVTAAVIAVIVIIVVICVWCYKKKRQFEKQRETYGDQNKSIIQSSQQTSNGHGYENNMAKIGYDDSFQRSPGDGSKLISYNDETIKSRSALDRFGHTPTYRGQSNVESRQVESRQVETARAATTRAADKSEERDFGRTRINVEHQETVESRNMSVQKTVRDAPSDTNNAAIKTPVLAALHSNPKFRKSFAENEIDAEERVRRVSDRSTATQSSSGESEVLTVSKPKLALVPKSSPKVSSAHRQKESARAFQSGHSSGSSAESKLDSEDSDTRDGRTKHTLHPSRGKSKRLATRKEKEEQSDTDERRKREKDRNSEKKKKTTNKDEQRTKSEVNDMRHKRDTGPGSVDDSDDRSQYREKEYEGRFKKSASGRKPKAKGQRMGRSRSTGSALEELDSNYQGTRSKSPSSVRSFTLAEDDDNDDELDSNYATFKRSGSKTSLYASRSSLYGRRRKNSLGETMSMSSYLHDDVDSRMGDFERPYLSHREKEKLFKSTGDLDLTSASAVVLRECATQTGSSKEVYIFGRKTVVGRRPNKVLSRGTQTSAGKERRDSTGSGKSGRSNRSARSNRLKSRSKSQESLRKKKVSRSREFSDNDTISERSQHQRHRKHQDRDYKDNVSERSLSKRRTKSRDRDFSDNEDAESRQHSQSSLDDDDDYSEKNSTRNKFMDRDSDSYRPKRKHKSKLRKLPSTASYDISDSDNDKSTVISSRAPSSVHQYGQQMNHFNPTGYPLGYPQPGIVYPQPGIAYTQPGVAYLPTAPGGPPMMIPMSTVPMSAAPQKLSVAPKPNATKWDQLVDLTDGMKKRRHQMGESLDTESVLSSNWSHPVQYGHQSQVYHSHSGQRVTTSGSLYGSVYPESVDVTKVPRERVISYRSSGYPPSDSNV